MKQEINVVGQHVGNMTKQMGRIASHAAVVSTLFTLKGTVVTADAVADVAGKAAHQMSKKSADLAAWLMSKQAK